MFWSRRDMSRRSEAKPQVSLSRHEFLGSCKDETHLGRVYAVFSSISIRRAAGLSRWCVMPIAHDIATITTYSQ